MTEEQFCFQMLVELHKSYMRDAQQYIDRLCTIRAMQHTAGYVQIGHALSLAEIAPQAAPQGEQG